MRVLTADIMHPQPATKSEPKKNTILTIAAVVAIPLALVLLWKILPMEEYIREAIRFIESTGPKGVIAFYLIYIVCGLIGIPRTLFNVAASAHILTFIIARTFAREWVLNRITKLPNVERMLELVEEEGFKLVFLLRLNPFIPGVLKGYGLGTTRISFFKYVTASFLGFLPIALAHVYLGWVGGEAMLESDSSPTQLQRWLLYGGVAASVILVVLVYAYGRRAMNRRFGD